MEQELLVVTGKINIRVETYSNEITYYFDWEGGDVIGCELEVLMNPSDHLYFSKGWLHIGCYVLEPIGFQSPSTILFRKLSTDNKNNVG